jgi:hypothetical protein
VRWGERSPRITWLFVRVRRGAAGVPVLDSIMLVYACVQIPYVDPLLQNEKQRKVICTGWTWSKSASSIAVAPLGRINCSSPHNSPLFMRPADVACMCTSDWQRACTIEHVRCVVREGTIRVRTDQAALEHDRHASRRRRWSTRLLRPSTALTHACRHPMLERSLPATSNRQDLKVL